MGGSFCRPLISVLCPLTPPPFLSLRSPFPINSQTVYPRCPACVNNQFQRKEESEVRSQESEGRAPWVSALVASIRPSSGPRASLFNQTSFENPAPVSGWGNRPRLAAADSALFGSRVPVACAAKTRTGCRRSASPFRMRLAVIGRPARVPGCYNESQRKSPNITRSRVPRPLPAVASRPVLPCVKRLIFR